jgi:hypothetical protein
MSRLEHQRLSKVNLTDSDAQLVKARSGVIIGYNAQVMVSPVDPDAANGGGGTLITATDVVNSAADSGQLVPMLEEAEEVTGERSPTTLAGGGYHTVANLVAGERRGQVLVMAERYQAEVQNPYFKDQFGYDTATDSYVCPHGHRLFFRGRRKDPVAGSHSIRVYRASVVNQRNGTLFKPNTLA